MFPAGSPTTCDRNSCEVPVPPKGVAATDQTYVPKCNLTDKSEHSNPFGVGTYRETLTELGSQKLLEQEKEGFRANPNQLRKMGLME